MSATPNGVTNPVLKEFIKTEDTHAQSLKVLIETVEKDKGIPSEVQEEIINATTQIHAVSQKLLETMRQAKDNQELAESLHSILVDYMPTLNKVLPALNKLLSNYQDILPSLAEVNTILSAKLNHLQFTDVIIMPIQRGPRIEMLLRDAIKFEEKKNPNDKSVTNPLSGTLEHFSKIMKEINAQQPKPVPPYQYAFGDYSRSLAKWLAGKEQGEKYQFGDITWAAARSAKNWWNRSSQETQDLEISQPISTPANKLTP